MFHSATGKIFCGQMKLKLSCLEGTPNTMCGGKKGTAHQRQNLIPTVKYGEESRKVAGSNPQAGKVNLKKIGRSSPDQGI